MRRKGTSQEAVDCIWTYLIYCYQNFQHHIGNQEENKFNSGANNLHTVRNIYNGLAFEMGKKDSKLIQNAYNLALLTKNYYLENAEKLKDAFEKHPDAAVRDSFESLKWSYRKIEVLRNNTDLKALLMQELMNYNLSLARLSKKVPNLFENRDTGNLKWQKVQTSLKKGEAAMEIITYENLDGEIQYAALILTSKTTEVPIFLHLNENKSLEAQHANYIKYCQTGLAVEANKMKLIYELYWKKIDEVLRSENVQTLYFSPDGIYNEIDPYAFVYCSDDTSFSRKLNIRTFTTTFGIAKLEETKYNNNKAYLYGNPDCWAPSSSPLASTIRGQFDDLTGAVTEVNTIAPILRRVNIEVVILTGIQVTEEVLCKIESPFIVHFAGHGNIKEEKREKSIDNLYNCFLPLTGSKATYDSLEEKGLKFSTPTDGILTGKEISQMNLTSTYLVVISACESGVGKIQYGEGVWGLQRAFFLAGTKNVIASLWKINDNEVADFMNLFYTKWLEEKMEIHKAFKETKMEMMRNNARSNIWAAFVLIER